MFALAAASTMILAATSALALRAASALAALALSEGFFDLDVNPLEIGSDFGVTTA